jgi:hypothetical protein
MKRRLIWTAPGFCALLLLAAASMNGAQKEKTDLKKIREEIGVLESVLNEGLNQSFGGAFGYLDKARGAYLPGFGVAFSFEINLAPSGTGTPFSPRPTPESLRAQRETAARRREDAKALAQKTLADFGHSLTALDPKESVAIVIHTVGVQPDGVEKNTIVIQCDRQLIDSYRANSIDRATFVRKLSVVGY